MKKSPNRIYLLFIFLFLLQINNLNAQKAKQIAYELPAVKRGETVICHHAYCFVYNEEHEQSNWVAYKLTKEMLSGKEPRDDNFKPDPLVTTGTADVNDYKGSNYDRGHLAPAADMAFDETAMKESFYFSNISPQDAGLNRGLWKKLETSVRDIADNLGTIYIVTGPVLKDNLPTIGGNEVSVPEKFYKAILYVSDTNISAIGFIMPNKKLNNESVFKYASSIDDLEKETGIDFFPKLPYFIEKKTEKQFDINFWELFSK